MNEDNSLTERRRRDFEDLNNEIAGRDVGRQPRFLGGRSATAEIERKEREARAFQNRLLELLSDPAYRAKYDATMQALNDADRATEASLSQLDSDIAALQAMLTGMENRAARLPDGTRVFRDANGVVRRSDGSVVEEELAATILWTGDEPSFELYREAQDSLASFEAQRDQVQTYQNDVLGPARDQLTDPDAPPELNGLDGILNGIEASMPDAVRAHLPDDTPSPAKTQDVTAIAIPDLGVTR